MSRFVLPEKKELHYFIPTRGRPDFYTWKAITPKMRKETSIVVREDEYEQYLAANPYAKFLILPPGTEGISSTRQFIIEQNHKYIVMLDDDIRNFGYKPDITKQSIAMADDNVVDEAFDNILTLFKMGYSHVSIFDRPRCGLSKGRYFSENGLAMQIIGFETETVHKEGLKFTDVLLAQDKHMTLSLLERGYKNALLAYFTFNCLGTQAAGGCSIFRTADMINEQATLLQSLHPNTVSITPKVVNYRGISEVVNKVTIQWKRSFRPNPACPQPNLP
jgi:hypothetical protein